MAKIGAFDTDAAALQKRVASHDKFGTRELNDWIFENLKFCPDDNALDLGCGFGKQSMLMLRQGCNVVAVDASSQSIDLLTRKAMDEDLSDRLLTINCEFDALVLPDIEFDFAVSSYAFYYSKDYLRTLSLIHKKLKKGGALFICGPAYKNNQAMKALLKKAGVVFGEGSAPFMEDEGPVLFKQVFGNVQKTYFENEIVFPNAEEVWKYWSSHNMFDVNVEKSFKENIELHFNESDSFITTKVAVGLLAFK